MLLLYIKIIFIFTQITRTYVEKSNAVVLHDPFDIVLYRLP